MRRLSWSRYLALLLAVTMLTPLIGASPAYAAATFTGGATDSVLYIPNDHTPIGFRFKADAGIPASATFYLKVRFTTGTSPSPSTNRGMTWNGTTGMWVPDLGGGNWDEYPTVTSDSSGLIAEKWVFAKFADEAKSGQYYVMISLQDVATGDVYNSSVLPQATVLDMTTGGAWMHNGTTVASSLGNKRVECTMESSSSVVYALAKSEMDAIDSDADGVVDNEDYGPAGMPGDFRLAIPLNLAFDVLLNRTTVYTAAQMITVADTDIALNASEQVAPSAPASFSVTPGEYSNQLEWGTASDAGGSGLAGYRVYRWTASGSTAYTLPKTVVATVTAGVTTYSDTGLTAGTEYFYEVRAVDGATNVGPRSVMRSGTPTITPPPPPEVDRTFGEDRYATAIAISQSTFAPSSVTTAVVATGKNFPDALSAAGLAGVYGSPILLVRDSVTASLTAELDRLGVTDVVLIGSDKAVSTDIENALKVKYGVSRVFGSDRYATSAAVAEKISTLTGGVSHAFFARGDSFADALAMSPFAYGRTEPVLLVRTDSVPLSTSNAIAALGITDGLIAGSEAAVSATTMSTLDGLMSGTLVRQGGANRYETARMIADYGVGEGWGTYGYVGLATGLNFPDALGGSAATAQRGGVLLLTAPTTLSAPAASAITANRASISLVEIYGSTAAVSQSVRDSVDALLE